MDDWLIRLQPLVGFVGILAVAYLLSTDRRPSRGRVVAWGIGLQVLFALLVLKTDAGPARRSSGWAIGSGSYSIIRRSARRSSSVHSAIGPSGPG